MKKIYRLSALFCATMLLVTSCTQEVLNEEPAIDPALIGSEIQFGARAGFENADESRTVYGPEYIVGTTKFQRIDWVDGSDMVEIMCEEANNGPRAHYVVQNQKDATAENDYGYLEKAGASALQWSDAATHTFYAMYPSSEILVNTEKAQVYLDKDTKLMHGLISNEQHSPKMVAYNANGEEVALNAENIVRYEAQPDMRYAYMAAKTVVTGTSQSVSFSFVPVVTAVKFSLVLPSGNDVIEKYVSAVRVSGPGIAGAFTADLGNWTSPYPTISTPSTEEQTISMVFDEPILLDAGESISFTMFLHPGADIDASKLTVSFSQTGGDWKKKKIGTAQGAVVIPAMKKSTLSGLKLPAEKIKLDYSNWMLQMKDDVLMKGLSLPGTGGSFSAAYSDATYKQQTLPYLVSTKTQTSQWDMGIRAFEIVCDRPSSSGTSLGEEYVKCNKTSMGVRVYDVITALLAKVLEEKDANGNPSETAMVILTYQPEGKSGVARNAESFTGSLAKMLTAGTASTYQLTQAQIDQLVVYSPELTLGESRGKLMIVARVNQQDESDGNTDWNTAFTNAKTALGARPALLVNGCGTSKDRWGARGYKVNGNAAWHQPKSAVVHSPSADVANYSVEHYLIATSGTTFPDWNAVTVPDEKTELQFTFGTNKDNFSIVYQEWARVVDLEHLQVPEGATHYQSSSAIYLGHNRWLFGSATNRYVRWYPSFEEKLSNATRIFNEAIADKSGSKVYINSLCGYLVDASNNNYISSLAPYTAAPFYDDYVGGMAGNIKDLADKINPLFGAHVRGAITGDEGTGPTGVIMMDFVSDNPSDGASYYLPGLIISNNIYSGNVDPDKKPVEDPEGGETEGEEEGM